MRKTTYDNLKNDVTLSGANGPDVSQSGVHLNSIRQILNGVKNDKIKNTSFSPLKFRRDLIPQDDRFKIRYHGEPVEPGRARPSAPSFDTLRLSPFSLLKAFCLPLLALGLSSCSFNPNMQGRGQDYIQGEWQQDTTAIQQQLVTSSRYHIKFDCDSFFVQISSASKVNYGADSCMRSGHWSEYIKGNYAQKNDTLYLKGQFCNPDFTMKLNADCFRIGQYSEFFKIERKNDSLIQLSGTSSVIPIQLHLIKKTSCHPKPL